jgi:hypothetical protein
MSEGEDVFMKEIMDTEIPDVEVVNDEDPVPTAEELKAVEDALNAKIPEIEHRDNDFRSTL